jgi:hypothetical protein
MHDIVRMSITRNKLYEAVWAEPMTTVAARYAVSSNYLARVCQHLNVPYPHRGYWAKRQFGKAPTRPPLPDARPGEVLEWERGDGVPRLARPGAPLVGDGIRRRRKASLRERPSRHQLVVGVRESFEKARLSEVGYLRPFKRNLVDIFVSKETLPHALDTANELFLRLEERGHRVTLATDHFHRPELRIYEGQKFDYYNTQPWCPGRNTVVFVGSVAFGLTLFEMTEHVEVTYEWDRPVRYARVSGAPAKRKPAWALADTIHKQHMPCGRLALRAYSPYGRVPWEQQWSESKAGDLVSRLDAIAKELEGAVPAIVTRREEAQKQAEIERQRWEAECRERKRREREQRRAEALKESRHHLLRIVEEWSIARSIEGFFEDAERRATALDGPDQSAVSDRLAKARVMLGGTDALARFLDWKSPNELVVPSSED